MGANKVLVMAGGTGGHVFPALAVAEELRIRGVEIAWLGTRRGIEAELVPKHNFPISFIDISGLRGTKGLVGKLMAPLYLLRATWQSLRVVKNMSPDAILGLGGFASGPGGVAAWLLRRPLVIHEQNRIAGTTNRLLANIATRVLEAFPGSLPGARHCGNPVRTAICLLSPPQNRGIGERQSGTGQRPRLLVLGGSLGALALNQTLPKSIAHLPAGERPEIVHQTGSEHLDLTRQAYADAKVEAETSIFINDMAAAYGWADLVVCRAGALTVSELTAAGLGSVLIPYPYAVDNHQLANAQWLVEHNAAIVVEQKDLTPEDLGRLLAELFADGKRMLVMARAARRLSRPDATSVVAGVCQEVMK